MKTPKRLWGNDFQLRDMLEAQPGSLELATRDFALLTMTAGLALEFPEQLVLKGGFVLRHVHGVLRFSRDVDATRHEPAKQRINADDVAEVIEKASIGDQLRFDPGSPATDSPRSLDFDQISVSGALINPTDVQLEVSYREEVVDDPLRETVGEPFYEEVPVLAMQTHEIAAEKIRTLAQRTRPTDLADLAVVLRDFDVADDDVGRVAVEKFRLVARGRRVERIEGNITTISADYDDTVPAVFPGAPPYRHAVEIVWPRIKPLIPS